MKNQTYLKFIGLFLVCVCLFSCTEQIVKVKSLSFADKYYLTPNDTTKGSLNVSIQMELPESYVDQKVCKAIRDTIISALFSPKYVAVADEQIAVEYFRELINEYRLLNEPLLAEFDSSIDPFYVFNQDYELEGFTSLNDASIYSYGINRYVYSGGAHGLKTFTYYNFDLKDGTKIDERDLFVDSYKSELVKLIKNRIVEQSDVMRTLNDLEQSDYWTDSIKPNGNFYLSDEGITYVFNPYEIAPYYYGLTEVLLPYSRLENLLRQGNPAAYLHAMSKKEE